jgi:uncharacterized damage-inducible protein DinB
MDRQDVVRIFRFHHWAQDKTFDALGAVSAAELDRQWGGSFGTGRALLHHVVGAERLWCERLVNGQSPRSIPEYPATHGGSEYRDEWQQVQRELRAYAEALTPAAVMRDLTYTNIRGVTTTFAIADILYHIVNHGTYHRGQITQLLRDLGKDAPSTDFIAYLPQEQR